MVTLVDFQNDEENLVYDWIHKEQIEWFEKVPKTGDVGIAFFHIPIPEYEDVKIIRGSKKEGICCPLHNSGFFDAVKRKGDVKGTLFVKKN